VVRGAEYLRTLAQRYPLDLTRVVAIRHSAGGQLALWLAAQRKIPLRGVVSRAGVADVRRAWELGLSRGAAELLGGTPQEQPERYLQASPIGLQPLGVPERLLHGAKDDVVPIEMSRRFQAAAAAAGDERAPDRTAGCRAFRLDRSPDASVGQGGGGGFWVR